MQSLLLVALLYNAHPAHAIPRAQVPDPRPLSLVSDPLGRLSKEEREAIDAAARAIHHGEIVVVVVDSTDGEVPRAYGTALFNAWGISNGATDDGVLLLAALDDRKAEIVLGDAIDGPEYTAVTDAIMADVMVPRFKAGQPASALQGGAEAVAARVLGAAPPPPPSSGSPVPGGWWTAGLGLGGAAGGVPILRALARNRPRRCPTCRMPMTRLSESADDEHLDPSERKEEELGSVDYDVWSCNCGEVVKLRYGAFFTRYSRCTKCQAHTKLKTEKTLRSATTSSTGLAQVREHCSHCGHTHTFKRSLPMLSDSSSSDSSSSSGGSSSGGGSSGSW